jgi:hypothetical protein
VTCGSMLAGLALKFLADLLNHAVTGQGGPDGPGRDGGLNPPQLVDDTVLEPLFGQVEQAVCLLGGTAFAELAARSPCDRRPYRDSESQPEPGRRQSAGNAAQAS